MEEPVKTRSYRSPQRREQAAATRLSVMAAARDLLQDKGYAATSVADVARLAGVSVDTVYASVGRKPELVLGAIDMTLGGGDQPVPADRRDYVLAIRVEPSARGKIAIYAAAVARLIPRTAPLQEALRRAGETDTDCAATWQRLVTRRADNMLLFAVDLRSTGELRDDLSDQEVADLVWSTNAAEYWLLLAQRGWTPTRYEALLVDLWTRMLLA
ncbi:MAG: helix-turn-helix domain-containing protein [Dermatophilaceae bacterium]